MLAAGAYAFVTLSAILAIRCDRSPDPQRFCVWWGHSAPPTLIGIPAVLALGCYASFTTGRRRPVAIAGALVVLTCIGLREAAARGPVLASRARDYPFRSSWASSADS